MSQWFSQACRFSGVPTAIVVVTLLNPSAAHADCTQSGNTVTCSPPGTNGYTATTDGITVNVLPGTTVVDTAFRAITVLNSSVVTNNGSIVAATDSVFPDAAIGIYSNGDNNVVTNNGSITASGAQSQGVTLNGFLGGSVAINSSLGVIQVSGPSAIGVISNGNNTIYNFGTINVTGASDPFAATSAIGTGLGDVVFNSGTINVGVDDGVGIFMQGAQATISNSGTINVTAGGVGISANGRADLTNSGLINASGTNARGINFATNDTGTLRNTNAIVASGTNSEALHISGTGSFDRVTILNSGLLQGTGTSSFALRSQSSFGSTPSGANITNSGTVDGRIGLNARGDRLINSGLINVTSPNIPIGPVFTMTSTGANPATFTQTGSGTLALRVTSAPATKDTFVITGAGGSATLAGTLRATVQAGLYANTTTYTNVLTANTRTGTFSSVTSSSPFFGASATYGAGSVNLVLTRYGFGSAPGMTSNERAVGGALEQGYSQALTGRLATFYGALLGATSLSVLDQLSGEGTAAAQNVSFSAGSMFNGAMNQRSLVQTGGAGPAAIFAYAPEKSGLDAFAALRRDPDAYRWAAWGTGFGGQRSFEGDPGTGSSRQRTSAFGGAFGVDRIWDDNLTTGFAVGATGGHFSVNALSTGGEVDAGHVGVYGAWRSGAFYLNGSLSYARLDNSTNRTITGAGPTEYTSGRFDADQFTSRVEAGWRYVLREMNLTPFVAIEPAVLRQHAYTETSVITGGGPGVLGLRYAGRTTDSLPLFLGTQIDTRNLLADGTELKPYARAAWVHEFEPERQIQAAFVSIPAGSFVVDGARPAADALRLDLGAQATMPNKIVMFGNFATEYSDSSRGYTFSGGVRKVW